MKAFFVLYRFRVSQGHCRLQKNKVMRKGEIEPGLIHA